MSTFEDVLSKVKKALNLSEEDKKKIEKFEEATVKETGAVIAAESFEVGEQLYLKTEEGDFIIAPDGEYELEDGRVVVVTSSEDAGEGVISEVREAEGGETEEEMKRKEDDMKKEEQKAAYVKKDEFEKANKETLEAISALGELIATKFSAEEKKEEKKDVKMSEEDEAKLLALKQQLSEQKKRKKVQQKKEEGETGLPEPKQKYAYPHQNLTMNRASESLANFDFEQSN